MLDFNFYGDGTQPSDWWQFTLNVFTAIGTMGAALFAGLAVRRQSESNREASENFDESMKELVRQRTILQNQVNEMKERNAADLRPEFNITEWQAHSFALKNNGATADMVELECISDSFEMQGGSDIGSVDSTHTLHVAVKSKVHSFGIFVGHINFSYFDKLGNYYKKTIKYDTQHGWIILTPHEFHPKEKFN
jgi:hypothetical protein